MRAHSLALLAAAALFARGTETAEVETIELRSGLKMPANGLGTCCRKTAHGPAIVQGVTDYLALGGRLIDTAMAYGNHAEIGEGVRASGVARGDLWITSKISGKVAGYGACLVAVADLLAELQTDYVDLLLVHTPKLGEARTIEIWGCLVEAKKRGAARAIGVSNCNAAEVDALGAASGELPEVNQIQYHPWSSPKWHQGVAEMAAKGVVITAYNSLGGSRFKRNDGNYPEVLVDIAAARGVTEAQLLLRWALSRGVAVIPGSSDPDHIRENLAIPPFVLDARENAMIEAAHAPQSWFKEDGPNKYGDAEAETPWHMGTAAAAAGGGRRKKKTNHRREHR